jgi:glycosyltransferase involved in cell wall biosynthesis
LEVEMLFDDVVEADVVGAGPAQDELLEVAGGGLALPQRLERPSVRRVVLVGTYPPKACGLATFTANLRAAIEAPEEGFFADVVSVVESPNEGLSEHGPQARRPAEVVDEWVAGDLSTLSRSIGTMSRYDAVLLQHEYGLFGGQDGEEVLALVYALEVPLISVLHTVLANPKPNQRKVIEAVIKASQALVVQSQAAKERLVAAHSVEPGRVTVVPHGAAPNFAPVYEPSRPPKVLTWGLLGPGKGIEHAIRAVARLRRRGLEVTYTVAGQTHPKVLATFGESYRHSLVRLSRDLGVGDLVRFDDGYRDWASLRALVRSADAVLLPYDSTDQVSSGVLVEAIASAKPVIATEFPHARELLSRGAGITVPHADPEAMADALAHVLFKPGVAACMSKAARAEAEVLLWPNVGARYRRLIVEVLEKESARALV